MPVVTKDLRLEHIWVLYPGDRSYALNDFITALPLRDFGRITLNPEGSHSQANSPPSG